MFLLTQVIMCALEEHNFPYKKQIINPYPDLIILEYNAWGDADWWIETYGDSILEVDRRSGKAVYFEFCVHEIDKLIQHVLDNLIKVLH